MNPTSSNIPINLSLSWVISAPDSIRKSALPDLLDTALLPCFVTFAYVALVHDLEK